MEVLAGTVVVGFGLSLLAFAGVVAARPRRAERFLAGFASSARAHVLEQALRLVVGVALVRYAPAMAFAAWFATLGWLIAGTAVVLLLLPWRWHHRFGRWVIPLAIRHLRWHGLAAAALGAFVLWGAARPLLA